MSLAPLINISILEYQINYLIFNNITQIFVFTGTKHLNQLEVLIQRIRLYSSNIELKLLTLELATFGDLLRDINSLKIIRGDFVLISPETITNTDLSKLIARHIDIKNNS